MLNKTVNAGELEYKAVQHCLRLAKKYEFDEQEAERVIEITSLCKHTKGSWKGKPFDLHPHQAFFLAYLFGLKKKDGYRLVTEAMLNTSKKSGKSAFGGLIAILMTFFDGEQTAENYVVANKTEQALFVWKAAKGIAIQLAEEYPEFKEDFKYYDSQMRHTLIQPSSENFFKTLPYESNTLDGVNPALAIIDEYHEYPNTSVPDNLTSGMVLRKQPLLLFTTTRGFHPYGPLAEKEEYYTNVLNQLIEDDKVMPFIYALDNPIKWKNKKYWRQCAPGINHGLPPMNVLEDTMKKAVSEGGETLISCKVKNFNIWQRGKSSFAEESGWAKGKKLLNESEFEGRKCFMSFDLGRTDDLSCLGYLFPPEDKENGEFSFILRTFIPEDLVDKRSREHKVSYQQWIDEGLVMPMPGNITDTTHIKNVIKADSERFLFDKVLADSAFAIELMNQLLNEGFEVQAFPQNYRTMTAPVILLQKIINAGRLHHGSNKVLSWMFSNTEIRKNTGGQMMLDKSDRITGKGTNHKKGRKKIDGMVVLTMCMGGYIDSMPKQHESVYEEREIRVI